jgi:hypothetical protein
MKKWKFITAGLVLLILILCMMTFYMNGKARNLEIQVNRMDREHEDLKRDYENLYGAYYSYDKKILKILDGNPNVFWAKDSSAYVVKNENEFLFSFYKKPRMMEEFFLYQFGPVDYYNVLCRIDTLKPHQYELIQPGTFQEFKGLFVAHPVNIKESTDYPDTSSTILKIYYP